MATPAEQRVIECARVLSKAESAMNQALREARHDGISWRRLATLANCPMSTVRRHVTSTQGTP